MVVGAAGLPLRGQRHNTIAGGVAMTVPMKDELVAGMRYCRCTFATFFL